jgi:hypothetical protein
MPAEHIRVAEMEEPWKSDWEAKTMELLNIRTGKSLCKRPWFALNYICDIPSRAGKQIFATGEQAQAELTRYDAASGLFVPFLGGVPAEDVSFSRDGGGSPTSPIPKANCGARSWTAPRSSNSPAGCELY